jgi:hypothetical protein
MSTTNQKAAVQQAWTDKWSDTFYWIGITMSVLCIALAAASNTELLSRFQRADFPLSWVAGAIAILAFLASEYFHSATPAKVPDARRFSEERLEGSSLETEFADL